MRKPRATKSPRTRELAARELARVKGGYTDDGTTLSLVAQTDLGDTYELIHIKDGNGGLG